VLDEDGEYFGCLSVNDLLKSLYKGEPRLHATALQYRAVRQPSISYLMITAMLYACNCDL
jgi:hypothetical protein